jgi:hypothetical protein
LKSYGKLTIPSNSVFNLVKTCEERFRNQDSIKLLHQDQIISKVKNLCGDLIASSCLPTCHCLAEKVINQYSKLRVHIHAKSVTNAARIAVQHGSKSAKARTAIK